MILRSSNGSRCRGRLCCGSSCGSVQVTKHDLAADAGAIYCGGVTVLCGGRYGKTHINQLLHVALNDATVGAGGYRLQEVCVRLLGKQSCTGRDRTNAGGCCCLCCGGCCGSCLNNRSCLRCGCCGRCCLLGFGNECGDILALCADHKNGLKAGDLIALFFELV